MLGTRNRHSKRAGSAARGLSDLLEPAEFNELEQQIDIVHVEV